MSTLIEPPSLTTATTATTSRSPSLSSIDSSSDDAPQLSFEYIWGEDGKFLRISKRSPEDAGGQHGTLQIAMENTEAAVDSLGASGNNDTNTTATNTGDAHAHLHDVLGNERTAENAQSIASVLSSSASAIPHVTPSSSRPFHRAKSGPAVTPGGYRPSLLDIPDASERPVVRARRVPIEEKRKEDAHLARKEKEDEERERENRRLRMREKEKENWAMGVVELPSKEKPERALLSSSLTRTQSDPYPAALAAPEQPLESHSQPLSHDPVPYRPRRPLSKQQRVLSGVPRPLEVLGTSRTVSKDVARSSGGSTESSTPEEHRPPRPASRTTGGARRITKEERERQEREAEREAAALQAQLEKQQRDELEREREREEEHERMLEQEREMQRILEMEEEEAKQAAAAQAQAQHELECERERYAQPSSRRSELEDRERERYAHPARATATHQRRESETVMPDAPLVPARLSPSARNVPHRDERVLAQPPGLSKSQAPPRSQHRRSPTAPEAHTHQVQQNGGVKGKTWALGVEVVGDVDRDLGGLGPQGESGVRERAAPTAVPQVQVNGAKNFTVNGKMYGKLDMIGKGGSSRVYRVITPSNEIYALKRVSLDRTDQETMQGYMNEIALLRRLDGNERIIQLVESEVRGGSKGHLMLVMECGEVDLARLIAAKQSSSLDMIWVAYYWKQMLEAVHVIHEEKIVHSDLKPANFVLVKGELKLIDFGIANAIANDTTNIQRDHQIGTVNYMSPESIEVVEGNTRLKVGRPSDVWSLGCILYQMIYGTPPFHQLSVLQKMRVIPDPNNVIDYPEEAVPIVPQPRSTAGGGTAPPPKKLLHLAKPVPGEVIVSLKSCLMKAPKERETIPQLLQAEWLHPKGSKCTNEEKFELTDEEVILDADLLRQVVSWAIRVGETTGMPKPGEFQETLDQTFMQLKSCSRRK